MTTRRRTWQREAILEELETSSDFRSAQQIHQALLAQDTPIGLATVYRNLQLLQESKLVDVIRHQDGETWYRLCHTEHHHHHLVCRACGKTVDLDAEAVERWVENVTRHYGFTQVEHSADLFGLCEKCSAQ